jgi:transposase
MPDPPGQGRLAYKTAVARSHLPSVNPSGRDPTTTLTVNALHTWLTAQLGRVSGKSGLAEAIRYALRHWQGLVLFLEDGRLELDTNTIERAIRPISLGRKNALFAGSDGGARHWAIVASLVATAKLNGVEPLAWLTDVLERMVSGRTKAHELERLLPWNWKTEQLGAVVHA